MDVQRGEIGLNCLCFPCVQAFEHTCKTPRQHSPLGFPTNHKKCLFIPRHNLVRFCLVYHFVPGDLILFFKHHIFYLLFMVIFIYTSFLYKARWVKESIDL